jgi:hypothetical protein
MKRHLSLRHEVLSYGWDKELNKGWMKFRCMNCGYEYRQWMLTKVWKNIPPKRPGYKARRVRQPYTELQLKFLAKYWRVGNGGVTVSNCKGCKPK